MVLGSMSFYIVNSKSVMPQAWELFDTTVE